MPNIISIGNTTLTTSDPYLNDLLYKTVKKDENATITEPWRFETLIVTGMKILLNLIFYVLTGIYFSCSQVICN